MLIRTTFAAVTTLASIQPASASLFRITGDLVDTDFGLMDFTIGDEFIVGTVGTFEVLVDERDVQVVASNPGNTIPETTTIALLLEDPWFGYEVQSASVTFNGITLTTEDLSETGPFVESGPDLAEFFVEGGTLADLAAGTLDPNGRISINFFDGDTGAFASIGNLSASGDPAIFNVILPEFDIDDGNGFAANSNGGLPNSGVTNVVVTLVPEPTSLALLGLTGLLVARPRR
ncbi:MAG: hypothetical protein AAGB26_09185 [Planctomycetota bacterium]